MKVKTLKEIHNIPEGSVLTLNEEDMYFEYEFNKEEDNYIGWTKVKLPYEAVINQLSRDVMKNEIHPEFVFEQILEHGDAMDFICNDEGCKNCAYDEEENVEYKLDTSNDLANTIEDIKDDIHSLDLLYNKLNAVLREFKTTLDKYNIT